MSTFVLIHGAGDTGWVWHLVEEELRDRGHRTVAPDLPTEDGSAGFSEYADAVVEAVTKDPESTDDIVVVGHSLGGFTAPIAAERLGATQLILLAAMVPAPGESPNAWWSNTGYMEAAAKQSKRDGGKTGNSDDMISFYNGVPEELAREAAKHGQGQTETPMGARWPMQEWPDITTRFILCRGDRFFPADFFRALVPERLGVEPEETGGGHCVMLGDPSGLVDALLAEHA